jgi:tetratricopeptide (TPR) repeat protein
MAKKPRKTRKELLKEPDEFMTISGKLIGFAVDHKTQLTYAVAAIVALALIISGYRFFSIRSENRAAALLNDSLAKYEKSVNDQKPEEAYAAVSADFELIIDRYNNKDSGKIARLTFANICYNAGKYEQAIELYQRSLEDFEKHPAIYNQVLSSLGYAFEQKEDYAGAAGYFDKLSQVQEPTMQGEALFNLGRIYDKMGQTAKSKAVFNKILEDHQDFIYIDLVKEKMAG